MSFKNYTIQERSKSVAIRGWHGETLSYVKPGDIVSVDTSDAIYSWTDEEYYKVKKPDGWINSKAIGEVLNGKHFS